MKESDLSNTAKQFLIDMGCSDLYGEVVDIDLIGINKSIFYAIELKTALNIKVLQQAKRRKEYCNYVYIAVPYDKLPRHYELISEVYKLFIDYHGLGLIGLHEEFKKGNYASYQYTIFKHPRINRQLKYKSTLLRECTDLKRNHDGGLQSHEVTSPYSWMIQQVKEYLKSERNTWINGFKNDGWVSIDKILLVCDRVKQHYASPKGSLRQTLRANFNNSWVEFKGNQYRYKEEEND